VIGYNAIGNGSNTVTIGNSSITSNKLFGKVIHADAVNANESATLGQVNTALGGYVTLATTQTITAQKTFTTSGGTDSVIISTTGAGFALDAIKAGNGEVIRVNKTSGTGNAMTVIGGNFEAPTIVKTGGTSSQFLKADGSVDSSTYLTTASAASTYLPLAGGTLTGALNGTSITLSGDYNSTSNSGSLLWSGATNKVQLNANAGTLDFYTGTSGYTKQLSISPTGAATFSGALNGTSASFTGAVAATGITNNGIYYGKANASFPATSLGYFALKTNNLDGERGGLTVQVSNATSTFIDALTINYTGAATFSSSVTAAGVGTFGRDATTVLGYFGDPNTVGNKYISFSRASAKTDIVNIQGVDAGVGGANIALQASGGNVGIGTASPEAILHVNKSNAGGEGGYIYIDNPASSTLNSSVGIRFGTSSGASYSAVYTGDISNIVTNASDGASALTFGTFNGTTSAERMRITSGGYVKASTNGSTAISLTGTYHEFVQNSVGSANTYFYSTGATQTGANIIPVSDRSNSSAFSFLTALSSGGGDAEFNLRGDGNAYADGSWSGGGADYAEYFEWLDGNLDNEDRRGYSVSLINDKIKIAEEGDLIIGVISGNASVIGDSAWNMWNEKYLRDDFQTYIRDENGDRILNPNFDPDTEYISREKRPEWGVVGLVGKLCIIKGQLTMPNWIKLKNISDTVEQWLIK